MTHVCITILFDATNSIYIKIEQLSKAKMCNRNSCVWIVLYIYIYVYKQIF